MLHRGDGCATDRVARLDVADRLRRFDGHRQDPLTDLGLTSGDFADITSDLLQLASPGHRLVFLEGGYDLKAIAESTAATVGAMVGEHIHPEPPSSGGPGEDTLAVVEILRGRFLG